MGQHQHDVDELARICLELAEESALPLKRDALIELPELSRRGRQPHKSAMHRAFP
jgi:hypothetical protein